MQNFTCCDFNEACWSSHSVNRYFSFSAKNTELKTAILQNCVSVASPAVQTFPVKKVIASHLNFWL